MEESGLRLRGLPENPVQYNALGRLRGSTTDRHAGGNVSPLRSGIVR